ncbi:tyrosine-type recombinase/integrase [Desulforamulus aquiferis]|nr:tyrosine-type recombinase/integrase [Desulforamulus aquiferis]
MGETNKTIAEHVQDFLIYLRVERGSSSHSIKSFYNSLRVFEKYISREMGVISIKDITLTVLRKYLLYLEDERENSPTTRAHKISTLRSFFTYLVSESYIDQNPALKLSKPKCSKTLPVYLTPEECGRFLQVVDNNLPNALRDITIIKLFLFTGIRAGELISLKVMDVDLTRREIKVIGKGSKERILPLNTVITEQLTRYLEERPKVKTGALFLNYIHGGYRGINQEEVNILFRKYANIAGIKNKQVTPHKLRHTFASLLHQNDVNIVDLQQLLGHSNIVTTQMYTHTNVERLKRAVEKLPFKEARTKYNLKK